MAFLQHWELVLAQHGLHRIGSLNPLYQTPSHGWVQHASFLVYVHQWGGGRIGLGSQTIILSAYTTSDVPVQMKYIYIDWRAPCLICIFEGAHREQTFIYLLIYFLQAASSTIQTVTLLKWMEGGWPSIQPNKMIKKPCQMFSISSASGKSAGAPSKETREANSSFNHNMKFYKDHKYCIP